MAEQTKERQQWHARTVEEILDHLETNLDGLSPSSARQRLDEYGANVLDDEGGVSAVAIVFKQLKSPLVYLLAGAALVSVLTGHAVDAAVIALVKKLLDPLLLAQLDRLWC